MTPRGGKREGAGRKAMSPQRRLIHVTIRLTEAQVARAKELGQGSIARGIRIALTPNEYGIIPIDRAAAWLDDTR